MEMEEWRPIPSYETLYEVSSWGNVRSLGRWTKHSRGGMRWLKPQEMKQSVPNKKLPTLYLRVTFRDKEGRRKTHLVHKLVAITFLGPRPKGLDICHNDGNSFNNRVENLRYDSRKENIQDQIRQGTHKEASKTECPRGHPLVEDNIPLFHKKKGWRTCKACAYARGYVARNLEITSEGLVQELSDLCFKYKMTVPQLMKHNILE